MDATARLPSVEAVDALPPRALPGFIAQMAALQTRAAARLCADATSPELPRNMNMRAIADREVVGVRDAARFLGVSPTALRRLAVQGAIPMVRIGRRVLFRHETLVHFVATHESSAPEEVR
jgi:excisionase family DNA binding protein